MSFCSLCSVSVEVAWEADEVSVVPEVIDTRELREFLPVIGGPRDKLSRRLRVCLVLSLAASFEDAFFVFLLLLLFSDRSEILSSRSLFPPMGPRWFRGKA